jgi:chromosome partitioning protein
MASCIAFHSYKGGTGKTTIAANLAALLAKKGNRVFLLDLDVYAPSLQAYFDIQPKKWINDFLNSTAKVEDIIMDLTPTLEKCGAKIAGKLWGGFCNSKKEEIYKLEGGGGRETRSKIHLLRRFILLREQLISNYKANYLIIDTSPGIRYWSINALAIADTLILTLKIGDLDIDGTKMMADEIYSSLEKLGAKRFLLLNKVAGYCIPATANNTIISSLEASEQTLQCGDTFRAGPIRQESQLDVNRTLSSRIGMDVISSIPCYCDIQFTRKEFLTALKFPDHPFAKQIGSLTEQQIKNVRNISHSR